MVLERTHHSKICSTGLRFGDYWYHSLWAIVVCEWERVMLEETMSIRIEKRWGFEAWASLRSYIVLFASHKPDFKLSVEILEQFIAKPVRESHVFTNLTDIANKTRGRKKRRLLPQKKKKTSSNKNRYTSNNMETLCFTNTQQRPGNSVVVMPRTFVTDNSAIYW